MLANTTAVPAARFENLVTTEADGEVLVYDNAKHHIHHLNASSAAVWRLCDGQRSVYDIAIEAGLTEDLVRVGIAKLVEASLLEGALTTELRSSAQSRRSFMKKAAIAGSVPVIVSVTAPLAAKAGSANCQFACGTEGVESCCDASLDVVACTDLGGGLSIVVCGL